MTDHVKRSHNKSLLLYHLVCPIRYRRKILTQDIEKSLRDVCLQIQQCFEMHFLEIGADDDHVHFVIQSVPTLSPQHITQTIKSITAREMFRTHPELKKYLWGGKFWTSGYYINTIGQYTNEAAIRNYVKNQGKQYKEFHRSQPTLFAGIN